GCAALDTAVTVTAVSPPDTNMRIANTRRTDIPIPSIAGPPGPFTSGGWDRLFRQASKWLARTERFFWRELRRAVGASTVRAGPTGVRPGWRARRRVPPGGGRPQNRS